MAFDPRRMPVEGYVPLSLSPSVSFPFRSGYAAPGAVRLNWSLRMLNVTCAILHPSSSQDLEFGEVWQLAPLPAQPLLPSPRSLL